MKKSWAVVFFAEGLRMEKLMNEAARKGLTFYSAERTQDRRMRLTCGIRTYRAFAKLACGKGYTVTEPRPIGMLGAAMRFFRRRGLMPGILLGLTLLFIATRFVWTIQIENFGMYKGEIGLFLQENGLFPGIPRSSIDLSALCEKLEWRLPAVQWVRAEMNGMTLRIRLEQGTPPPDIQDRGEPGDVVAAEDGILLRLTVFAGTAVCKSGDPVRKGQILIKGEETDASGNVHPVKARGEAVARVFRSAKAQSGLYQTQTIPTGRRTERRVLAAPLLAFSAQEEPAYLTWDEERSEIPVGGAFFPIWLRREIRMEAALENVPRSEDEARQEASEMAFFALEKLENSNDFIDKWVDYSMIDGGVVVATATAELRRDIARYQRDR